MKPKKTKTTICRICGGFLYKCKVYGHIGFVNKSKDDDKNEKDCQDPNHSSGPFCPCRFKDGWR